MKVSKINGKLMAASDIWENNKIDKINGEVFIPYGIILDENKMRLYISERKNHQILMTDIAFNRVKSVGSLGNTNNQFNDPCGLCFGNNNKYI